MAIKMRNNTNPDAICCECKATQKEVLNMFDICIEGVVHTLCDECSEEIYFKCLKASVMVTHRKKTDDEKRIMEERDFRKYGIRRKYD